MDQDDTKGAASEAAGEVTAMEPDGSFHPDYQKIRRKLLTTSQVSAVVIIVMEYLMLFLYSYFPDVFGDFNTPVYVYFINNNVLPPFFFCSAICIAWYIEKKVDSVVLKNYAPIAVLVVICTCIAAAHWLYSPTMAVLCFPIFMVSIYGNSRMRFITFALCVLGLALAVYFRSTYEFNVNDIDIIPDTLISFLILVAALLFSKVLSTLFESQRTRLANAVASAEESRKTALEASSAKSNFLANMSHEIRTPLNAVIGMNELIYRKADDSSIRQYAGDALQAGNALLSIVGDIIDVSKIESGEMDMDEIDYDVGSLLAESMNMVDLRIKDKGLASEVVCDEEMPSRLAGDEYRIRQILVNLLTNAVKYTDEGSITLEASGERDDDGVFWLKMAVKDTGIGIRPEDLPALFDKFNRTKDVRTRNIEGVGLGLNIALQLAELMGGDLTVESVYCVGTKFTLRVPQRVVDAAPMGPDPLVLTASSINGADYAQLFEAPDAKVLVVDDVASNLRVITYLLKDSRMSVDTASSGDECLSKARRETYDLILMDHLMPKMDGIETLAALRALNVPGVAEVPVIALTANVAADARQKYMEAGFADYISKPVHAAELEQTVMRNLPADKVHALG